MGSSSTDAHASRWTSLCVTQQLAPSGRLTSFQEWTSRLAVELKRPLAADEYVYLRQRDGVPAAGDLEILNLYRTRVAGELEALHRQIRRARSEIFAEQYRDLFIDPASAESSSAEYRALIDALHSMQVGRRDDEVLGLLPSRDAARGFVRLARLGAEMDRQFGVAIGTARAAGRRVGLDLNSQSDFSRRIEAVSSFGDDETRRSIEAELIQVFEVIDHDADLRSWLGVHGYLDSHNSATNPINVRERTVSRHLLRFLHEVTRPDRLPCCLAGCAACPNMVSRTLRDMQTRSRARGGLTVLGQPVMPAPPTLVLYQLLE